MQDVLGAQLEGGQVIASIKHYPFTMPDGAPANITVAISEVDTTKAMAFFYGAGYKEVAEAIGVNVFPYIIAINATTVIVKASDILNGAAGASVTIIEYI